MKFTAIKRIYEAALRSDQSVEWLDNGRYKIIHYSDSGQKTKVSENNYLNNVLDGKSLCWYANGDRLYEDDFVNGQLHGKVLDWEPGGTLGREANYRNHKLNGKTTWWDAAGEIDIEIYYIDNEIVEEPLADEL